MSKFTPKITFNKINSVHAGDNASDKNSDDAELLTVEDDETEVPDVETDETASSDEKDETESSMPDVAEQEKNDKTESVTANECESEKSEPELETSPEETIPSPDKIPAPETGSDDPVTSESVSEENNVPPNDTDGTNTVSPMLSRIRKRPAKVMRNRCFYMDDSIYGKLEETAKENGMSVSELLSEILQQVFIVQ